MFHCTQGLSLFWNFQGWAMCFVSGHTSLLTFKTWVSHDLRDNLISQKRHRFSKQFLTMVHGVDDSISLIRYQFLSQFCFPKITRACVTFVHIFLNLFEPLVEWNYRPNFHRLHLKSIHYFKDCTTNSQLWKFIHFSFLFSLCCMNLCDCCIDDFI